MKKTRFTAEGGSGAKVHNVVRRGDEVIAIASEESLCLTGPARQPLGLVSFFAESPLADAKLTLKRKAD
jgi:hypothetical protein